MNQKDSEGRKKVEKQEIKEKTKYNIVSLVLDEQVETF